MRTFASAFTLPSGGSWWNNSSTLTTKSTWNTKLSSSGVIVDAKNERHVQSLLTENNHRNLNFTVRNSINSDLIPGVLVNNRTVEMKRVDTPLGETDPKMPRFENAFHFTDSILAEFNRYKFVYKNQVSDVFAKGVDEEKGDDGKVKTRYAAGQIVSTSTIPSLFNPYFAVNVVGMVQNIPVHNDYYKYKSFQTQTELASKEGKIDTTDTTVNLSDPLYTNPDYTDCSIKTLVHLSQDPDQWDSERGCSKELGQETFRYADFMFCKDVGRISNNYMITLRRFAYPIGDNITNTWKNNHVAPDIGRMICYIGEDNKLEDILKYQYNATWKELNSKIQEKPSEDDKEERGIIGSIVNLSNPSYLKMVGAGKAGSGNKGLKWLTNETIFGKVLDNNGTYEGNEILGNYDNNRVYEPKDTVQDTHVYEGKLKFSQEFTLTFNYEMRAYDNINPRTAFLDLLANVHVVTYRQGRFWGGEQKIVGYRSDPSGWAKANAFIDQAWDKIGGFCEGLMLGNVDWQSVWGSISSAFGKAADIAGEAVDAAKDVATGNGKNNPNVKKAVDKWKSSGLSDAFKGMLKNKLGRPAMYGFDSLLSGAPVGFHHVTIGNPRAPIMSMGNLIITNTSVQHYGPLGIDDFPTGLKVTVTLKHAKSRDSIEIQQMYTGGSGMLAMPFNGIRKLEKFVDFGTSEDGSLIVLKPGENAVVHTEGDKRIKAGDSVIKLFGTNNADQIVANAAINAKKT